MSHVIEHEGRLYPLGRHLDAAERHDPQSRSFPAAVAPLRSVQHGHHGPVLDQGQLGACTGFACSQALNCDPLIPASRRTLTGQDAVGIYVWATHHDPFPGCYPPEDTGSDGLSVAKAARKLGLIGGYRHAFGLAHTLGALVLRPLIAGIPWRQSMFTPGPDGVLDTTGPVVGGHEIALVGLSVERETVTILNSWGAGWGREGTAELRWTDLGGLLADGGDATVLLP